MGGRGGMITTPISLQDLRRRIYVMAKADKTNRGFAGRGGVRRGSMNGSGSSETTESAIGLRTKALLVDRSHNPWREADRRAAYGKSVRAPRQSSTLRVARARAGAVLVRVVAADGHGQDAGP